MMAPFSWDWSDSSFLLSVSAISWLAVRLWSPALWTRISSARSRARPDMSSHLILLSRERPGLSAILGAVGVVFINNNASDWPVDEYFIKCSNICHWQKSRSTETWSQSVCVFDICTTQICTVQFQLNGIILQLKYTYPRVGHLGEILRITVGVNICSKDEWLNIWTSMSPTNSTMVWNAPWKI